MLKTVSIFFFEELFWHSCVHADNWREFDSPRFHIPCRVSVKYKRTLIFYSVRLLNIQYRDHLQCFSGK